MSDKPAMGNQKGKHLVSGTKFYAGLGVALYRGIS